MPFRILLLAVAVGLQARGETNRLTMPQSLTFHDGGGGSSVLRDAIRLQEVYLSDQFPPHPIVIHDGTARNARKKPKSKLDGESSRVDDGTHSLRFNL